MAEHQERAPDAPMANTRLIAKIARVLPFSVPMVNGRLAVSSVAGQNCVVKDVPERANSRLSVWNVGDQPCVVRNAKITGRRKGYAWIVEDKDYANLLVPEQARAEPIARTVAGVRFVGRTVLMQEGSSRVASFVQVLRSVELNVLIQAS